MAEVITGTARDICFMLMDENIPKDKVWDLTEHKVKRKRSISSNNYYKRQNIFPFHHLKLILLAEKRYKCVLF